MISSRLVACPCHMRISSYQSQFEYNIQEQQTVEFSQLFLSIYLVILFRARWEAGKMTGSGETTTSTWLGQEK